MATSDPSADELTLPIKRTDGDTLEARLTGNAYHNILPARYLRKDSDGEPIESQEDLFERVARNVALAEAVFEAENQGVDIMVTPEQLKPDHLEAVCEKHDHPLTLRRQPDYDHSYFFIATFIEDHLRYHAEHLYKR